MSKITVRNDFHNTKCVMIAKSGDVISQRRLLTIKRKLCDVPGCICGGSFGERGEQSFKYELDFNSDGSVSARIL